MIADDLANADLKGELVYVKKREMYHSQQSIILISLLLQKLPPVLVFLLRVRL